MTSAPVGNGCGGEVMTVRLPDRVSIREVGPRDGFQNIKTPISTGDKLRVIRALLDSGIRRIELTSFVKPSAVPQLADAHDVAGAVLSERRPGVRYAALVANPKGAERAVQAGVDEILFVVMSTETFNMKNFGRPVGQSLEEFRTIAGTVKDAGIAVVGCVGTSFGCPYEGDVPLSRVLGVVEYLLAAGADEIDLADTTGMATPRDVELLVQAVRLRFPGVNLILHFHNTRGIGLANVLAGVQAGVTTFDASVGGLGGCPFAPRATGNVATEDVVHMLGEMGVDTGVSLDALLEAVKVAEEVVGAELPGQVGKAGRRRGSLRDDLQNLKKGE